MDFLEVIVGVFAAVIALRALKLQRNETIKNGRMSALIHSSNLIQQRIDYYDQIIENVEKNGNSTKGHKTRVNDELRPLKKKIDFELLDLMGQNDGITQVYEITKALQSKAS
jgi:uncharacterized radical SAM superfamily protein